MNTNKTKFPKPHLPTTQQVLEDIIDRDVVNATETQFAYRDELLTTAYKCYKDFKQLEHDIQKQNELKTNLDSLHEKLNESINNMKKQKK